MKMYRLKMSITLYGAEKKITCIGCLTPHITSGIVCSLSHFQIMKNLNLCVMAEAILFFKLLDDCTEKIDRHNKMSFRDILFLHIVLFYPR